MARAGVVLATFAVSAGLGWMGTKIHFGKLDGFELAMLGIVVVVLLAIALRRPQLGVLGVALTPFLISLLFPTGTNAVVPMSLVAALAMVLIWIVWMLVRKEVRLVPSRINLPILLFILVSLLSLPFSYLFWRPEFFAWREHTSGIGFIVVQLSGLMLLVLLPTVMLMAANLLRGTKWVRAMFAIMLIPAVPGLAANIANINLSFAGFGLNAPGLYHLWLIALLYSQLLFNPTLKNWQRAAFIALIAGWLFWAFILRIENISFWAPTFVALLFLTGLKSPKALLIVVAVGILPVIFSYQYYYQHVYVKAQVNDFNRFWLWPTIISLVVRYASPIIGAGPVGYYPYIVTLYPDQGMSAHNNYVDIFAETGIIGFLLFIGILAMVLRTGWRLHRRQPNGFNRAFSTGAMAGLVGMMAAMMLNDWFLPFIYNGTLLGFDWNVYAWILLGVMVAMDSWVPRRAKGPAGPGVETATTLERGLVTDQGQLPAPTTGD